LLRITLVRHWTGKKEKRQQKEERKDDVHVRQEIGDECVADDAQPTAYGAPPANVATVIHDLTEAKSTEELIPRRNKYTVPVYHGAPMTAQVSNLALASESPSARACGLCVFTGVYIEIEKLVRSIARIG
jgi:hypothetical protein